MMKLSITQFNQVLRNIHAKRRGINIGKKELMSAVARGCCYGKMPEKDMAIVINFLIHEQYIEVLNNRVYICFDYIGTDKLLGNYVHWDNNYAFQTVNIRAFDAQQKAKKEVKKKSCAKCALCCPKDGQPCDTWELLYCKGMSDEAIAKNCTYYKEIVKDYVKESYYSPHEVYSMNELV